MPAKWKSVQAHLWERAPFYRLLLPFAAGIAAYDYFYRPGMGHEYLAGSILICLTVVVVVSFSRTENHDTIFRPTGLAALMLLVATAGYELSYLNDIRNDRYWFGNRKSGTFMARVTDHPAARGNVWRMPVCITGRIEGAHLSRTTGNAFLYIERDSLPPLADKGDTIAIPAHWTPIRNAGNPGEFDYAAFCRRNNIFFRQYCTRADVKVLGKSATSGTPFIERAHEWSMCRLKAVLADSVSRGLVEAMILGDGIDLDQGITRSWSAAGIVHIIAISGGNVLIFLWVVSLLFLWVRNKKYQWLKFVLSVPLVWAYVLIAGAAPSAIRAAIMFTFLTGVLVFRKGSNPLNQLFGSAFLMLVCQPAWLFGIGFQLSFIAVLSLILFYRPILALYRPVNRVVRRIWETLAASLAAEILVAPLVVWYFHNFPLMFLVANVAAMALMGFVQLSGMALIVVGTIPVLGPGLCSVTTALIRLFNRFVTGLNGLSPGSFQRIPLSAFEMCTIYMAIAGFSYFIIKKNRVALFAGLVALNLLALSLCYDEQSRLHQSFLVVYNAGRNDYIELVTGKKYRAVVPDTIPPEKKDYVANPAHIVWQTPNDSKAGTPRGAGKDLIFCPGGKLLLICAHPEFFRSPYHVDYVYVTGMPKVNVEQIDSVFSPEKIILKNKSQIARRKRGTGQYRWRDHVFLLQRQGAFVAGET